jgi:hypothetical protein
MAQEPEKAITCQGYLSLQEKNFACQVTLLSYDPGLCKIRSFLLIKGFYQRRISLTVIKTHDGRASS